MADEASETFLITDKNAIDALLRNSPGCCCIVRHGETIGATDDLSIVNRINPRSLYLSHPVSPADPGSSAFRREYGVRYAYMAGAMAGGIAGERHVIALGSAGILGTFGAGGLPLPHTEDAIVAIKASLAGKPFAVNLIHNTFDRQLEMKTVELLLKHGVTIIEASAFMRMTTGAPLVPRCVLASVRK